MISCSTTLILSISSFSSAFKRCFGNKSSSDFDCCLGFKNAKPQYVFFLDLHLFFVCFWKVFPRGEYVNLACSIIQH